MKIALCFIISYEHILNKEDIWKEWIEPNKDIINIYFYYKDFKKIKSKWIMDHALPSNFIHNTSYFYVMPAYISILKYAITHDNKNKWFCMLTDSCCPIISPEKFRYLFYKENNYSLFSWKPAWWNPYYYKRGNLAKLPKELWLANDPWFILTKKNVQDVIFFTNTQKSITKTICSGGLANETFFAVAFKYYKELEDESKILHIKNVSTHIADWNRRSSPTSPHVFKNGDEFDIKFINSELKRNSYHIFIRKVSPEFPDKILKYYIYEYDNKKYHLLIKSNFAEIICNKHSLLLLFLLTIVYINYFYKIL